MSRGRRVDGVMASARRVDGVWVLVDVRPHAVAATRRWRILGAAQVLARYKAKVGARSMA